MTSRRLEQQYLRLLNLLGAQSVSITLQELADKLCCTKRHMRTLLVQMQQAGWLIWQAEAGRGRRSYLQLLRNTHQLLIEKAEQLLDSGDFNEAIALLGEDKQLITPLLRTKLGIGSAMTIKRCAFLITAPCPIYIPVRHYADLNCIWCGKYLMG